MRRYCTNPVPRIGGSERDVGVQRRIMATGGGGTKD